MNDITIQSTAVPVTATVDPTTQFIMDLCDEIHGDNVRAGWWSDLQSGESILATRNRPELMMLVVSEVSEAAEGLSDGRKDDKLPHLAMFDVELADAAIRLFDMLGAETVFFGHHVSFVWNDALANASADLFHHDPADGGALLMIVNEVSAAMEHYRKGRFTEYRLKLVAALAMTFAVAAYHDVGSLLPIIEEKRVFNRKRADHKPENRRKEGGKAF